MAVAFAQYLARLLALPGGAGGWLAAAILLFLSAFHALGIKPGALLLNLITFTKTLALELGKFGVTANAIAPGFIESDMTRATAQRLGVEFDEFIKVTAEQIPVGRTGRPEDIAHAVSFLVSEGAGFVSGQVIYVAGGPRT